MMIIVIISTIGGITLTTTIIDLLHTKQWPANPQAGFPSWLPR